MSLGQVDLNQRENADFYSEDVEDQCDGLVVIIYSSAMDIP
jgi:hypothetical protein